MKHFAKNSRALSLVPYATQTDNSCPEGDAVILTDPFDGWLNSVAQVLVDSKASTNESTMAFYGRPRLTSTDEIRVDRATIRESKTHRHWPREVVEKFLEAEVITPK
ncbi:MAG: hypothetical protein M3Y84_09205 [Acidobacteriota bacterium]|nr:hypothetical protein [Acidobacteriota bacterium]